MLDIDALAREIVDGVVGATTDFMCVMRSENVSRVSSVLRARAGTATKLDGRMPNTRWLLPPNVTALLYYDNDNFRVSPWYEIRDANETRTLPDGAASYYRILDRATGEIGPEVRRDIPERAE